MKILLVEDDSGTADYLRKGLSESGYAVDVVGHEETGDGPSYSGYDLIVRDLDVGGPGSCKIPANWRQPILFLAGRKNSAERPPGPGDCLYKPFTFAEFLARVRSLLNPRTTSEEVTLRVAGLDLDLLRHRASRDGTRLELTPKEFLLLSLLMRRCGEVLSRAFIADQVWEINFDTNTNFVDVHIRRLRSKVDDPFPRNLIHTVRGMGYVLEDREDRAPSIPPRQSASHDRFAAIVG